MLFTLCKQSLVFWNLGLGIWDLEFGTWNFVRNDNQTVHYT